MKVIRKTEAETDALAIGDVFEMRLPEGDFTLTAIKEQPDGTMLCVFDQIIEYCQMNKKNDTTGGYEKCYARKRLQEIAERIPNDLLAQMVPFENGDMLRLATMREVFGCTWDDEEYPEEQIEYFKDAKNRVATLNGKTDWWWLQDVVSAAVFAYAAANGYAGDSGAAYANVGLRPFALLQSNIAARKSPQEQEAIT